MSRPNRDPVATASGYPTSSTNRSRRRRSCSPEHNDQQFFDLSASIPRHSTTTNAVSSGPRNTLKRKKSSHFTPILEAGPPGDDLSKILKQPAATSTVRDWSAGSSNFPLPGDRQKREKGKAIDRPESTQSQYPHSSRRPHTENATDKSLGEKQQYTGPLSVAEFERMKKEIESLRKNAIDNKKIIKKQTKRIEELKVEIASTQMARKEQETELQAWKSKYESSREVITGVETSLQCQICMDILKRPFALSPCGHILCLLCLQEWFRMAPPSPDDIEDMGIDPNDLSNHPDYLLNRSKSCPCCRAIVTRRPVPVFVVKAIASLISNAKNGGSRDPEGDSAVPDPEDDPWKDLFPSEDENDDSDEEYYDFEHAVGWGGFARGLQYAMSSDSESEGDDEDGGDENDDENDNSSDEAYYGEAYVAARWEPPNASEILHLLPYHHRHPGMLSMLRRGCPHSMIQLFNMEYSHERGLVAHLSSLEGVANEEDLNGNGPNRLFLGWNVTIVQADYAGRGLINYLLHDLKDHPERWELTARLDVPGAFDASMLVRARDVEQYDTSDTDAWLDSESSGREF
ncbi:hypothetical protein BD779DRAFT_1510999 [Infundibulicybe gibba]|nr:hypothetical protein BD779DRAFT_1510999 [Infundibulicybe gibba]